MRQSRSKNCLDRPRNPHFWKPRYHPTRGAPAGDPLGFLTCRLKKWMANGHTRVVQKFGNDRSINEGAMVHLLRMIFRLGQNFITIIIIRYISFRLCLNKENKSTNFLNWQLSSDNLTFIHPENRREISCTTGPFTFQWDPLGPSYSGFPGSPSPPHPPFDSS